MGRVGEIPSWVGTLVERRDGLRLGQVEAVHLAERAIAPTSLLVRLTDGSRTLIPLDGVVRRPGAVRLL